MDPAALENVQHDDHRPEIPLGPSVAAAHGAAAIHNATNPPPEENEREEQAERADAEETFDGRQPSHAHHVEFDHFDPEGVNELRLTLSRMSGAGETGKQQQQPIELIRVPSRTTSAADSTLSSEATLRATNGGQFSFEKCLKALVRRLDDHNIKRREIGVVFEDLQVVGLGAAASYQPTLGSQVNPLHVIDTVNKIRHPPIRDILSGFEGCVRPGEMLLVLGRPGAGCTTLLKVLANQRSDYHAIHGEVHYDSLSPEEVAKHYRGDVQYCPEDDVHFPTLTVKETLDFAARTRTPRTRFQDSRKSFRENVTEILATIFGLRHVKDTLVGDASIRGVSGGEKKRVSIAEVLSTRSLLTSWDNSTRGLDASTALEFVRALRLATDIAHTSTIVSIYQAGEQLYELFDKVCVIYDGKMAYFGPADRARQYFIDMGYEPANRQTTADYLVAVTDPNGRTVRPGFEGSVPRTADEFAAYFRESEMGKHNRQDVTLYKEHFVGRPDKADGFRTSYRAEHAKRTRQGSSIIISIPMQARALMLRRLQIIKGAKAVQVIQALSFVLQAIIVGTIFLRLSDTTATFFSRGGVLFFSLLFAALSTMAEIPALFSQRPIVLRHSKAAMYHPFVESLALTLVDVPFTAATIILFSIVLYFLVGLQQSAGQFFTFLLFVFTMTITMKGWFRSLAAAFQSPAPAQAVAGISVLILTLYTGYTLPQPYMIGALRWLHFLNPLRYGFEALMVNEFHTVDAACSELVPSGTGYENVTIANQACTTVGSVAGQANVNGLNYLSLSYDYSYSNLWRNYGIVVVFGVGFILIYLVLTEFNTHLAGDTSIVLFKRGSKARVADTAVPAADEEKQASTSASESSASASAAEAEGMSAEARKAMAGLEESRNTFSFQNLVYTVPVQGGKRKLLEDISGYVAPGRLTALMGESGAGKTTLLNVLSERTSSGVVTGNRLMNGQPLPVDFRSQTGYVQQMDTHMPYATVREALLFSAKLRQPASVSIEEKEAYVDKCLKMCGLEEHADAVVGSLGVEHRKRTTIGVELVAKPSLIFLDEPTSGLDSQSAWAIVCFLRSLADSGQSIVCTIHQPSAELFESFDRLLLLRKGGQTVYFGDLGHRSTTLLDYFQRNGGRACNDTENPAEYILDVIGAGATATSDIDWYDVWKNSSEAQNVVKELEVLHAEGRQRPSIKSSNGGTYPTSWGYQVATLLYRDAQAHWRDPSYMLAKLGVNIASGLLIGFTFFKAKDSIQGTQNKLFAVFMSTIISVPLSNQLQVPFLNMRTIYEIRERHSNMYNWTALITSQILIEIPWNILGSTLYFLCWYWTVGFPSDRGGFTYLLLGVVYPFYYTTVGQAVAAMCPNAEIAALAFSFLFSFVLSFDGVLQPYRELGWWQWMYHLSPYTYLIEALLGQAIGHSNITCASVEIVSIDPPSGQTCQQYLGNYIDVAGGYLLNSDATSSCEYCEYSTTDAFLGDSFNIYYSHHWRDFGIFCAFIVFNTACIYIFTWLFRIRTGSMFGWLKKRLARRS